MQRRKFIAGMGSLAAAGAAGIGTGAFTSVSADRAVTVKTADDANALLGLDASSGTNSAYAKETSNGEVTIDISDSSTYADANGVNSDALTKIHEIFEVKNNGTQPAFIYVDPDDTVGDPPQSPSNGTGSTIYEDGLYVDPQGTDMPNAPDGLSLTNVGGFNGFPDADGDGNPDAPNSSRWVVDSGESFYFGLWIDAEDGATGSDYTMTINADADLVPSGYSPT